MTKDEFYSWCDQNELQFEFLIAQGEKPSVDRINPKDHYRTGNLRMISLRENIQSVVRETKPMWVKNIETGEIFQVNGAWACEEFKKLGIDPSSAQKIAKRKPGKGSSYKGFTFSYDPDQFPV